MAQITKEQYEKMTELLDEFGEEQYICFDDINTFLTEGYSDEYFEFITFCHKHGELGEMILQFMIDHFLMDKIWDDEEHDMTLYPDEEIIDDETFQANVDFLTSLPKDVIGSRGIKMLLSNSDPYYDVFKNIPGLSKASKAKLCHNNEEAQEWIVYDTGDLKTQEEKDLFEDILDLMI